MIGFIDKMSKKERVGLFVAAAFIFMVLADRLIVAPISNKLSQLGRECRLAEKQLSTNLRNVNRKDNVSAEYQKYMQYIKKSGSDEEEIARMLAEIEELGRSSNLSLADMKPQPPKTMGAYRQYSIEIEAEGDEESVTKFLYKLNNSLQLLRAEKTRLYLKDKNSPVIKSTILITKLVAS